ncbi:MAG TPA: hypothetical protein VLB51_11535 [Methylomirabilota bacterium]|nr:hypothetical protein [Methylomirabilota bacterium]
MSHRRNRLLVTSIVSLAALVAGAATASEVDLSLPENGGQPRPEPKPFVWNGTESGRGLLDDFNRADGPLGPNWTVQAGSFAIVSQAARGSSTGLATHNQGRGDRVAMDIAADGTDATQYAAAVLNYGGGMTNLFIKIQVQGSTGFNRGACYMGNNDSANPFGLGFFTLSQPFASARMEVSVDASRTVTIDLTNVNGGALPDQQYVCTGAPPPEGPAIGMAGYAGLASIDNFYALDLVYPPVGSFAYPVPPIDIPCGLAHNGGGGLIGTDLGTDSIFGMHPTSPTGTLFFGPADISATSKEPIGLTHDNVTIYVTDSTDDDVDLYDGAAQYISSFSVSSFTSFPEGIAWAPFNGHLYVVNGSSGNAVHEFTTGGTHIADYPVAGSSQDGLAWDFNRECFWLYDSGSDSIRQFTPTFTQMSRSPGTIAAGFGRGEGLAVIGDVLYLVAIDSDTVVEFDISSASSAAGFIFSDGFEAGNLAAWSSTLP